LVGRSCCAGNLFALHIFRKGMVDSLLFCLFPWSFGLPGSSSNRLFNGARERPSGGRRFQSVPLRSLANGHWIRTRILPTNCTRDGGVFIQSVCATFPLPPPTSGLDGAGAEMAARFDPSRLWRNCWSGNDRFCLVRVRFHREQNLRCPPVDEKCDPTPRRPIWLIHFQFCPGTIALLYNATMFAEALSVTFCQIAQQG